MPRRAPYSILASFDLKLWETLSQDESEVEGMEYIDSQAYEHNHRFYRLQMGETLSPNVIGYVSMTLAPGFSMIANPLETPANSVAEMFASWPDGTTLNRFDPNVYRLAENSIVGGKWTRPFEKLSPGDGAIFFNPTNDFKTHCFVGEVTRNNLSLPIPSGFSMRGPMFPQAGSLDDLNFPIANGDVIHLFDADKQNYVLHPYENGEWTSGAPLIGYGESFWVAKTAPGTWVQDSLIAQADALILSR
jgi:hypothetical protein